MPEQGGSRSTASARPAWRQGTGLGQGERAFLQFEGKDDHIGFPAWTFPIGAFTMELLVRPEPGGMDRTLFHTGNAALRITIQADGQVRIERNNRSVDDQALNKPVVGDPVVTDGLWHHLAASYDGTHLRLFVDGKPAGATRIGTGLCRINALPSLGGYIRGSFVGTPYCGGMAGIHVRGEVLVPSGFRLLP